MTPSRPFGFHAPTAPSHSTLLFAAPCFHIAQSYCRFRPRPDASRAAVSRGNDYQVHLRGPGSRHEMRPRVEITLPV